MKSLLPRPLRDYLLIRLKSKHTTSLILPGQSSKKSLDDFTLVVEAAGPDVTGDIAVGDVLELDPRSAAGRHVALSETHVLFPEGCVVGVYRS